MNKSIVAAAAVICSLASPAAAHAEPYPPSQDPKDEVQADPLPLVSANSVDRTTSGPLPQTGANTDDIVLMAAAALAGGIGLLAVNRRRRTA
jgi:LPXTG-motif cell wall-anchored protein